MSHIFISYSRQDKDFVDKLRADLEKSGVPVWIDTKGIRPGAFSWEEVIREAIEHASAVLFVASPDARLSSYVKGELMIAQMYDHPIYPIWAAGKHWIECVPMNLSQTQHIDARESKYATALPQIVEALGGARPELALSNEPAVGVELRNPYKGLLAFTEEDREFFFGREKLTDTLAADLEARFTGNNPRLIAVVGASGSGKSSVVMAGLLPRLDKKMWTVLKIVPGTKPLESLLYALADVYDKSMSVIEEDLLNPNGLGVHRIARRLAKNGQRVLLFVDQFEEVFTLADSEHQRRQFLNLLTNAAIESDGVLATVLTMRADYYDRPMNYPQFGELVQNSSKSVMAMSLLELLEAIEQPAVRVGLRFESGIVTEMVNELRDRAGALPLLQFTLNQLYEKRAGTLLTGAAYTEIGGVQGAIGHHADEVFDALLPETQEALPRVAAKLVNIDETATATRSRALLSEFDGHEPSQQLVDALVKARLLIAGKEDAAYVEVSHEALLTHWGKLVATITTNKEGLRQLSRLQADAREWERLGKPKDMLWSHARLTPIYELCHKLGVTFDPTTAEFATPETDRLLAEFSDAPEYRQRAIVDRLENIGVAAIPALIEALRCATEESVLKALKSVLVSLGKNALALLIPAIKDSDEKFRSKIAQTLGELGDAEAALTLIEALDDLDDDVQSSAAYALGNLQDERAIQPLIDLLYQRENNPHSSPKPFGALDYRYANAAISLGTFAAVEALEPLLSLAQNGHAVEQETAARALGQIGDKRSVPVLIEILTNPYDAVRLASAAALGQLNDIAAIDPLIEALHDTNDKVQDAVVIALGILQDNRAIKPLLTFYGSIAHDLSYGRPSLETILTKFRDDGVFDIVLEASTNNDPAIRLLAISYLKRQADIRAFDRLIEALSDNSASVRGEAAGALGELKDVRAVEPLIKRLHDDDDINQMFGNVRQRAAQALANIGDLRAVEPLIGALRDENNIIRHAAAQALGELNDLRAVDPLIVALEDDNSSFRQAVVGALGVLGDVRAVEPLIKHLRDDDDTSTVYGGNVKQRVAQALANIGDLRAVDPLIVALRDENSIVREAAAQALGQLNDLRAVEPLLRALQDEGKLVRRAAAAALGLLKDIRAVEPLIQYLGQDDESEGYFFGENIKQTAAQALANIGDVRAVEPLIVALEDENNVVRRSVATALGQLKDTRAIEPLIKHLREDNDITAFSGANVKERAAQALIDIGDVRAVELLLLALEDQMSKVRDAAATALWQLATASDVPSLIKLLDSQYSDVRVLGVDLLGKLAAPLAIQPLIQALNDQDANIRQSAVYALGQMNDTAVIQPLIQALNDQDANVRAETVYVLGQRADLAAVDPLKNVFAAETDEAVKQGIAWAQTRFGDFTNALLLINTLYDNYWGKQAKANFAEALEKWGTSEALEAVRQWQES